MSLKNKKNRYDDDIIIIERNFGVSYRNKFSKNGTSFE